MLEQVISRLQSSLRQFKSFPANPETEAAILKEVHLLTDDFDEENLIDNCWQPTVTLMSQGPKLGYMVEVAVLEPGASESITLQALTTLDNPYQ